MKKQNWYGLLGFLSLLGWIGVFTQERVFLLFFAFAVDFQYFFLPSDEMLEESMARCAARGFLFACCRWQLRCCWGWQPDCRWRLLWQRAVCWALASR